MAVAPYKYSASGRKHQVEKMFDSISRSYDFLNHLLSFNIDKIWRKKAIAHLVHFHPDTILDIATGTADFAIAASRLKPKKIIGVDLSDNMLKIGEKKVKRKGLSELITLSKGDSENIHFEDNSFDAVTVGFGVRNFEKLEKGLSEIYRVLNPGGALVVLEFSKPKNFFFRKIYLFYLTVLLPKLGHIVSGNRRAYLYFQESVTEFPYGNEFVTILEKVGFEKCEYFIQTLGVATIYLCQKSNITV
jgi:demethylmenaquinone methyltransferase / 2-methoxy-6-polyprenyl-1,4-benzoquinol methylase